ncbi:cytochrome P450 [Amycolatopsis anabasis]|uniref:cytochrome P450 n=1 Tax=Amycolatopsis anabasis TaxID=1840409 RepID=UPI00131C8067|nr:cytochrome P450 [Amycolatopsis anabasis]
MKLPDLGNPDFYVDGFPHELFVRLRREEPVAWCDEPASGDFPGGTGFWVLTKHADVSFAGKNPQIFSSHAGGTFIRDLGDKLLREQQRAMLSTDPPEHATLRKIVSRAFTPRMVAGMRASMEAHADNVVDALGDGGDLDLVDRFSAEMPILVLADILGMPSEDRRLLYDWTNRMVGGGDPTAGADPKAYASAFIELFGYAAELTKAKRANPGDDVWSMVVNAEVDGERLSDEDLNRFFQLLVIAGNETTRNLLTGSVLLLSQHPGQWRELRANPDLLNPAIEEVLRFHSPVTQFRRTAVQDVEIRGTRIKSGDKVVLCYASANRDEDVFADPGTFDITRTENPHLAFGSGQHFCLGNAVARLEARVILPKLFERFRTIEVTGPPVRQRANFINGITELPVRLSTRAPARV